MLPAAAPPSVVSTYALSPDEEHPDVTALAAGEDAGAAGAVLGAVPPPGKEELPPAAGFPWTGPQAAASAPVASNVAVPSR